MPQTLKSKLAEIENLQIRAHFKPETLNEKERSIEFTISTEKAVKMWGYDGRYEEILLAEGARFDGDNLPVLDSHDAWSVENLLGSSRNNRVENGEVIGRFFFSSKPRAQEAFNDAKDGHLNKCSIGYNIESFMELEPGQETILNGRSFKAGELPLRIVTQYLIREASLVIIPKNDEAKIRGKNMPKENEKENGKEPQVPNETKTRGDTLDSDEFNLAYAIMQEQKGLKGEINSTSPSYLLIPPRLRQTGKEITDSPVKPGANNATININQGEVEAIVVPELSVSSNTAWYLVADSNLIDTVEVAFLQGFSKPKLEQMNDFDSDCRKYKVKQPFAAKALEHRGMHKNAGA